MSNVYEQVRDVVAELLKIDAATIEPGSTFVDDLGADSMKSVELVAALEEAFDIEMDEEDALKVKTVGDAASFIEQVLADSE
jgi:acyl carrier protein